MLNPKNFEFGRNFVWFVGVVEDRNDPNYLGRVRARCFGFHTEDRVQLPTEDLPWAMVMQSINSAAQTEVGESPTGLVDGSWVIGFFMDGEEAQQPLVLGSLGGYASKPDFLDSENWAKYGFKDVRENVDLKNKGVPTPPEQVIRRKGTKLGADIVENNFTDRFPRSEEQNNATTMRLARGIADERNSYDLETSINTSMGRSTMLFKEPLRSKKRNENVGISTSRDLFAYDQPTSPYNAIYPYNHVKQTESGHVVEFDDTPDAERIHEYHRSGTFREIHPSGKSVTQIMDEQYNLTESNSFEYVKGSKYETYKQGYYQLINADELGGAEAKIQVVGSANFLIEVENGNLECVSGNSSTIAAKQVLKFVSHEIKNKAHLIRFNSGNLRASVDNEIELTSKKITTSTGSHHATATGNYNVEVNDNIRAAAGHSITLFAQNTLLNPQQYIPKPIALHQVAGLGNIEINAQDGDTKIVAKSAEIPEDIASFVVTSAKPFSITSLAQQQPSPEREIHSSRPGSIVGQTKKGYIYFKSYVGNIVLEAETVNSIKFKTNKAGSVESVGGKVLITSTARNVDISSTLDTTIDSNKGFYTTSKQESTVKSDGKVFVKAGDSVDVDGRRVINLHTDLGKVNIGQRNASEPAIKGRQFLTSLLKHNHLTAMGPTGPVNVADGIVAELSNSFCTKTFVF